MYLRYAVSVNKHALESVVHADVIQDPHDDLSMVVITWKDRRQSHICHVKKMDLIKSTLNRRVSWCKQYLYFCSDSFNTYLLNNPVSLGSSPTSTILARSPESKERLNSRRSVTLNKSSWSHGTSRASRSTVSTSACRAKTDWIGNNNCK